MKKLLLVLFILPIVSFASLDTLYLKSDFKKAREYVTRTNWDWIYYTIKGDTAWKLTNEKPDTFLILGEDMRDIAIFDYVVCECLSDSINVNYRIAINPNYIDNYPWEDWFSTDTLPGRSSLTFHWGTRIDLQLIITEEAGDTLAGFAIGFAR